MIHGMVALLNNRHIFQADSGKRCYIKYIPLRKQDTTVCYITAMSMLYAAHQPSPLNCLKMIDSVDFIAVDLDVCELKRPPPTSV